QVLIHRNSGNFVFGQLIAHRHGGMRHRPPTLPGSILFDLVVGEIDQRAQHVQGNINVAGGLAHYSQVEDGTVVRQQHAIAIIDKAAIGGHILRVETVAVGAGGEVIVTVDLKVEHPGHEAGDEQADDNAGDEHAPV